MNDEEIHLAELFHRINRRILGRLTQGVKPGQYSMTELMVLWTLGKRRLCRASDLAERIGVPASTLTGVLDRLELQGFLVRVADSHDRRSIQLQATDTLEAFIKERMSQANAQLRETFSAIPPERLTQMAVDLQLILDGLEEADGCSKQG